jgi:hypothetical protein
MAKYVNIRNINFGVGRHRETKIGQEKAPAIYSIVCQRYVKNSGVEGAGMR